MAQQTISIIRGTTNTFGIALTNEEGAPVLLEEGQVIVFGVKKNPKDIDCIFVKRTTGLVDDVYCFTIEPSDTIDLEVGRYFYDVGIQHGDSIYYNAIESSIFNLEQNITKLGDGE